MKHSICQLKNKEQNALHCIKQLLVAQLDPLMIYCFGFKSISTSSRSAFFKSQIRDERQIACDLLVIMPEGVDISAEKKEELSRMLAYFGESRLTFHSLDFMLEQIRQRNLFFSWVPKNALLLHCKDNSTDLLPEAPGNEFWPQACFFFLNDPEMVHYLDVRLEAPRIRAKAPEPVAPPDIRTSLDPEQGWQTSAPS
ncbi:hypothetical protein GCM10027051_21010 [Niabella terrae]